MPKNLLLALTVGLSLCASPWALAESITHEAFSKIGSQLNKSIYVNLGDKEILQLVKNRDLFLANQGEGTLWVKGSDTKRATILINDNPVNVALEANDSITKMNIGKYTRDGYNTIEVQDIYPEQGSVELRLPYPTLVNGKADPIQAGFSQEKLDKIDQIIEQEVQDGFPGAVLFIAKNGKVIKETAYGYQRKYQNGDKNTPANLLPEEQFQAMTTDTVFDLASNTKMYAANYAIMKLVSEGKLDIDFPIANYIPEYTGDGRDTVTTRDILTHSAGYAPDVKFFNKEVVGEEYYSQNEESTKQLVLSKVPFVYEKGSRNIYSDTDYMLAGVLVERITNMPFDEYVEKHIYQPLGLAKTLFNPLEKGIRKSEIAATELHGNSRDHLIDFENIRTRVIQGTVHDEKSFYSMGGVSGHAGLFSTARELGVLASVMLNRGGYGTTKLFNSDVVDQFSKPSDNEITFGIGWRRGGNRDRISAFGSYASPYAIGHTGWTGINTLIDPMHDLVIVLLTNKKHSPIVDNRKNPYEFFGDGYETGKYGSIMNAVYDAFLNQ